MRPHWRRRCATRSAATITAICWRESWLVSAPRALIGDHVVATLVGLAVLHLTGPQAWGAAAAVGLAVLAMVVTGTFHPPAGINPLLVVSNSLPWSFLLAPVLAGALLLTAFALVWHRWIRRRPWPQRWW